MKNELLTEEEWLTSYGIHTSTKGYWFWVRALELCGAHPQLQNNITKKGGLYSQLAEEFEETTSKIERAMRHACHRVELYVTPKQVIGDYLSYICIYKKKLLKRKGIV